MPVSEATWVWEGNELRDAFGQLIASVRSDVIFIGQQRLLVESTPPALRFRARATTASGEVFTVKQRGITVGRLVAQCGANSYDMRRVSVWRKERIILGACGPMARIRPLISGKVEVVAEEFSPDLPDLDAVFLSWACVLVDSPVRRPRH